MNKLFFLFFPLFLFAEIFFPYTLKLKKDEVFPLSVYYQGRTYHLKLRWTLYKNGVLTLLYRYDNFPHQITLFKSYQKNSFRIDIAKYPEFNPYFLIEFIDFNDKIATFKMYLFNGKEVNVEKGIK